MTIAATIAFAVVMLSRLDAPFHQAARAVETKYATRRIVTCADPRVGCHDCDKPSDRRAPGADNCHCCGGTDRLGDFYLGELEASSRK